MNSTILKKIKSGLSAICAAALLTAGLPGGFLDAGVAAEATGEDGYYYAPAKLYDFRYDTEVIPDYRYTYTQSGCPDARGGNRWHNGSQVPYEMLNREISQYYTDKTGLASQPALYFGNYWGSSSDCYKENEKQYTYAVTDGSKTKYYSDNAYKNFWVSANNAPGANNGYAAVQGLVDSSLKGFDASVTGSGDITQNNVLLPQFNDEFIDNSQYCERYAVNNGFPFDKRTNSSGQTVYYYDSLNKNNGQDGKIAGKNRYYNKTTGNIEVQNDSTYNYRSDSGIYNKETGFYPFNGTAIVNSDRTDVNYGFGMRLDIPFSLDAGGKVNNAPATFSFSGDDDIWVFIDGKLALDLGGDHAKVSGSINFASGEIKVSRATNFSDNKNDKSKRAYNETGTTSSLSTKGITISSTAQNDHVMTVFYMERGLFESNLSMDFTFVPKSEVVPANVNENDLTIKEITEFGGVNPGLLSHTKAAADKDSFDYTIESVGSGAGTNPNPNIFPYFKDVYRTNSEAYGTPQTLIADDWGEDSPTDTTSGTGTGTKYIYVRKQPNSCCFNEGTRASFSIYLFDSTDTYTSTWVNATYMSDLTVGSGNSGFYYFRGELTDDMISKYDKYIVVGYSQSASGNTGYATWSPPSGVSKQQIPTSGGLDFIYDSSHYVIETPGGGTPTLQNGGSIPQNDGSNSTSTTYTKISKDTSLAAGNSGALVNIPFALTDPFATESITGITNATGHFKLLYGETASFNKQFTKYCTATPTSITVKQNENVYNRTADEVVVKSTDIETYHQLPYDNTKKRTLEDYYSTNVFATDAEGNSLSSYQAAADCSLTNSENTYFQFRNKNSSNGTDFAEGEKPVRITETFVNTVKTTDIKIAKDYTSGSDSSKRFTFKIAFNTIFGVTGVDKTDDYSNIVIYINNAKQYLTEDGEFTITSQDEAIIKGIPVGTKYTVTEKLTNTGYTNDSFTKQVGSGTETTVTDSGNTDTAKAATQEQTVATADAGKTVVIKAKNALDASAETVGIAVEKRWISADADELAATNLKLLLQRKASDEEGWIDIDTITLNSVNASQTEQSGDYVWNYTKNNLLKYKGSSSSGVTYSYRILEYSADGTALLLADDALYTEHCRVTYTNNSVNAKSLAANATGNINLINTYDIPLSVPKAGAEGVKYIFTFGITAIALSGAALMIYKKKLRTESRRERSE